MVRTSGIKLAHFDRFDYRRRYRESIDVREDRHQRCRLGTGDQHREVTAAFTARRICLRGSICFWSCKKLIPNKQLYEAPKGTEPPPFWIRVLLILTCTGVSFFHGSNDGQKGMGLIMLILIGTVPTAYA